MNFVIPNAVRNLALKTYHVYIMSSSTRTLYVGVTNNMARRVFEHKNKLVAGFTAKYDVTSLLYAEECSDVHEASPAGNRSKAGGARRRLR